MRKIVLNEEVIQFDNVNEKKPIFVKYQDKLIGMVIKNDRGWYTAISADNGVCGYHETLKECIKAGMAHSLFEYFVE